MGAGSFQIFCFSNRGSHPSLTLDLLNSYMHKNEMGAGSSQIFCFSNRGSHPSLTLDLLNSYMHKDEVQIFRCLKIKINIRS